MSGIDIEKWPTQKPASGTKGRISTSMSCWKYKCNLTFTCPGVDCGSGQNVVLSKSPKLQLLPNLKTTRTHTHTHAHTDTHRHTDTQTHRHTDTETQRHTATQTRTRTQTHRHTATQTHGHTDTQTHRHTDTQTHRHTDTQTHPHTHTPTHPHTHTPTHPRTHARTHALTHSRTHTHTHTLQLPKERSHLSSATGKFRAAGFLSGETDGLTWLTKSIQRQHITTGVNKSTAKQSTHVCNCRYVRVISPDIPPTHEQLRWQ